VALGAGQRWYAICDINLENDDSEHKTADLSITLSQSARSGIQCVTHTHETFLLAIVKVHNSYATERHCQGRYLVSFHRNFNENEMTEIMCSHIQINPVIKSSSLGSYLHFLYFNQLVQSATISTMMMWPLVCYKVAKSLSNHTIAPSLSNYTADS